MESENDSLALAARWVYLYNVQRPHLGKGMKKQTSLEVLQLLGYTGLDQIALFPPLLLDKISTDLLLSYDPEDGNDLLAKYEVKSLAARFVSSQMKMLPKGDRSVKR